MTMNSRSFFLMPWFLLALFFLFVQHPGWNQNQLNMDLLAHWPEGTVEDIQIIDDVLYYADGATFMISDVSDPIQPTELGSYTMSVSIVALLIDDHIAYVGDGSNLVHILDISNAAAPQFVAQVQTSNRFIIDMEKRANYLYIAHTKGLSVVDVSDELQPIVVNFDFKEYWFQDLLIDSTTLFATDRPYGLRVFSLNDPTLPKEIGSFEIDQSSYSIDRQGDNLYVTDDSEGTIIFDVSDPATPLMVNKISGAITHSAVIVDSILYCARGARLDIFNVADPSNPQRLNRSEMDFILEKIRWSDHHLFVTSYDQDLYILDVADAQNPIIISSIATGGITRDIFVQDQLAYVANSRYGLRIMDISDPADPVELSLIYTGDIAEQIMVKDQIAFIANYFHGIITLDVTDPQNPIILDEFDTGWAEDLVIKGAYIYMADRTAGLVIINIADPANLIKSTNLDFASNVVGLDVAGDYAYMAAHNSGFYIMDIADPIMPVEVGHLEGNIWEVFVVDQYAYLADYDSGLRIIDISDPSNPVETGRIALSDRPSDLIISGNYAYLAVGNSGVRMIDIKDPANPFEHGYFQQVTSTRKISASEDYIFLYDRNGGVYVLDGQESTTPVLPLIDQTIQFECIPNPFSETTQIRFYNSEKGPVEIRIFDQSGKQVNLLLKNELPAGDFMLYWDGIDASDNLLPVGFYFCQMKTSRGIATKKLVKSE